MIRWYYLTRKKTSFHVNDRSYTRFFPYSLSFHCQCTDYFLSMFTSVNSKSLIQVTNSIRYSCLKKYIYIFFKFCRFYLILKIKEEGRYFVASRIFLYNSYIFTSYILSVLRRSYLTSNKFIFIFVSYILFLRENNTVNKQVNKLFIISVPW